MPPRLYLLSIPWTIAFRPKAPVSTWRNERTTRILPLCRNFADSKDSPAAGRPKNIDTQPLLHVSKEAAKRADIAGSKGPEIEQGTPVEEVVKGDKEAQDKLPKSIKDSIKSFPPKGSRSFSTSAFRSQDLGLVEMEAPPPPAIPGIKFGLPALPIPSDAHLKYRYDPVVKQVTNLLMRHGKLSIAQRNMSLILTHLRTSPPPTINPARPLIPGAPPPSHLPLNPILYLTLAIDSVAPLLRIRSQKGAAGGGVALQIPVPLGLRQRRRAAVQWILTAATKRKNRGSGKGGFAQRVAEEMVAVVEGKSSVWERRNAIHKLGVAARANLNLRRR
ncbi:ribosomal protein S7 [Cenococcum geophilum 1.58]|uniref:Ribosomal protein S7 n=1 Tax=Cenococcum geophilum 1.58 TaxID=794803 RepID=A0ACC8EKB0_9PEZI|nr:ribosomal protein S7 [Cenococcum geophilum 1.58]